MRHVSVPNGILLLAEGMPPPGGIRRVGTAVTFMTSVPTGDRSRWNNRYGSGRGPRQANPRLRRLLPRLRRGRVLDVAGGVGANARLFAPQRVVVTDISDEALSIACSVPSVTAVLADARALPFATGAFDTIVCAYYYEPAIDFAALLAPGGTLFFETYSKGDTRYRRAINPAYLFDPEKVGELCRGLEILLCTETDDGARVFATVLAIKPVA